VTPPLHSPFGYNPPTGDRGDERAFSAKRFGVDLMGVLDFVTQHFGSIWVADHHMDRDRFRLEGWTQLTWMAARYPGVTLGTEVLAHSFRHPPHVAKMAATLQYFSNGRLVLGYGAGSGHAEYGAYGYDYPPVSVRIAQMEEAVRLTRTMWRDWPATFDGEYYRVKDAYCEPRPSPEPPIMIGGEGERFLLPVVARHADWWLSFAHDTAVLRHKVRVLDGHCADIGRDPSEIRKATPLVVYLDRDRKKARRWAGDAVDRPQPVFAGDPAELRDQLAERREIGFELFLLAFSGFPDTDDIELFVDEVMPHFL
jgi:alkanesulfonate monooxygenase SsuD/methylene tetrahydromethanopterin reductase-like flavin-dependent oxidoreductase (luciferase family)